MYEFNLAYNVDLIVVRILPIIGYMVPVNVTPAR